MKAPTKFLLGLLCFIPLIASAVTRYEVAHTRISNQDVIIFTASSKLNSMPNSDKEVIYKSLTACANDAGLSGKAVLVWPNGNGGMAYYGPKNVLPFLNTVNLNWVKMRINKKLAC